MSLCKALTWVGSYASPPLGWGELHNLFGILLHGRFVFSVFIQSLFTSIWTSWYGFLDFFCMYFELLSNTAVFTMLLTFQLWLLGALSVASCIHLTCSHHCVLCMAVFGFVCVWLPYFMALNYYGGLSCLFSFPSPRFSYFPSESCFCLLEKSILRKQRSRPCMNSLLLGFLFLWDPLTCQSKEITCLYVYIYMSISGRICNCLYL